MNRRNFMKNIMVAGAAFSILPGAGRVWKAVRAHPEFTMRDIHAWATVLSPDGMTTWHTMTLRVTRRAGDPIHVAHIPAHALDSVTPGDRITGLSICAGEPELPKALALSLPMSSIIHEELTLGWNPLSDSI